jgi:hypothetical protein
LRNISCRGSVYTRKKVARVAGFAIFPCFLGIFTGHPAGKSGQRPGISGRWKWPVAGAVWGPRNGPHRAPVPGLAVPLPRGRPRPWGQRVRTRGIPGGHGRPGGQGRPNRAGRWGVYTHPPSCQAPREVGTAEGPGLPQGRRPGRGNGLSQGGIMGAEAGQTPKVAQPMAWERGYCYRVRKEGGRVVRGVQSLWHQRFPRETWCCHRHGA